MKMFTVVYTDTGGKVCGFTHNAENEQEMVEIFERELGEIQPDIEFVIEHEADSELERKIHNHGIHLDEEQAPDVWVSGYQWFDRGPGRAKSLVIYKVHNISTDDVEVALNDTANTEDYLVEAWNLEDPIYQDMGAAMLDLIAESDVEKCGTCAWWCHESEIVVIDGENVCAECREEEDAG